MKLQVQERWGLLGDEMFETGLQVVGDEGDRCLFW